MIIKHRTDQDLYKISMQQAVWRQYPKAIGTYLLAVRTEHPSFPLADLAMSVQNEINSMSNLEFDSSELDFLASMPWLKKDYLDWLSQSYLCPEKEVKVIPKRDGGLRVEVHGEWHKTIEYEVQILAIIEELYCAKISSGLSPEQTELAAIERLKPKIEMLKAFPCLRFTDFGTRRRFSAKVQRAIIAYLVENCPDNFAGTSNLWFAKEFGIKAIGTVAHEWIMGHLALVDNINQAQKRAMHVWLQEYGDSLGTALTDTFTTKVFWKDFDGVLARAFSGIRHDSGDPVQFAMDAISHYKKLGIDPLTKSIIFSDSLDFPKMVDLFDKFSGKIGVGFGIGTNLMNDVGVKPLSIVMKLLELNGTPLVKISDISEKIMGNPKMVTDVCNAYGIVLSTEKGQKD